MRWLVAQHINVVEKLKAAIETRHTEQETMR
ncbi:MAG: hypothetical protein QOF01_2489 [Thermomicrobiales bacterium]|jgi:hypothetical protein|nr:hypothetical protein [Thermomicrobiales bacterium]MEA2529264.1 hypothetical protein [Thermomicrobiales bacterium]MEA2596020.1 hypothetical protein [Thermomicrobiales bacterium]